MKQEKINYSEIISLGFTEEETIDNIYFKEHGFDYVIINKYLTKNIYLDWAKETKLCKMVRIDSPKTCNIKAEMPIINLAHLKELINFFSNKKEKLYDANLYA